VTLEALEITRGHDGLLRGKPEPALLFGVYRVVTSTASLVGRLLRRISVTSAPPCVLPVEGAELRYETRPREAERFAVVALAVEEDSGDGVTALYGSLEAPETFALWSLAETVPEPRGLAAWVAGASEPPDATRVQLLVSERHAREVSVADDFVSACALSVVADGRQDEIWRMPFADESGRNQWTATVRVRVG